MIPLKPTHREVPHFTSNTNAVPIALLGTLALGAGGRLAKNLASLMKREPADPELLPGDETAAVVDQTLPVTPEQARRLQERGVNVKLATKLPIKHVDHSILGGLGYGALGATGLLAGWKTTDAIINKLRRRSAESELNRVRERLKRVLSDEPDASDAPVYETMKMAEDYFFKKASIHGVSQLLAVPAAILGGGMVLHGYGSYRQAQSDAKSKSKLEALRRIMDQRKPTAPRVRMVPTVSAAELRELVRKDREEREKAAKDALPSASPAEQALQASAVGV